jgi:hypothetical protein
MVVQPDPAPLQQRVSAGWAGAEGCSKSAGGGDGAGCLALQQGHQLVLQSDARHSRQAPALRYLPWIASQNRTRLWWYKAKTDKLSELECLLQ